MMFSASCIIISCSFLSPLQKDSEHDDHLIHHHCDCYHHHHCKWFYNFRSVSLPKSFWPTVKHKTFHIAPHSPFEPRVTQWNTKYMKHMICFGKFLVFRCKKVERFFQEVEVNFCSSSCIFGANTILINVHTFLRMHQKKLSSLLQYLLLQNNSFRSKNLSKEWQCMQKQ